MESTEGQIAQVDFGYVGKLLDPESRTLRKAWCFVMVLAFSRKVVVRVVVATHSRRGPGRRSTREEHLPEHRRDARHRSRAYWEERASVIAPEVATLVSEVFDSDDVLLQLRTVQAMVTYLEGFPVERARAASVRASFYGVTSYGGLKQILVRALDREPLPNLVMPRVGELDAPRFARNVASLMDATVEVSDEPH